MKITHLFAVLFFLFCISVILPADNINIYYFKQQGCPNCEKMNSFLKDLKKDFPNVRIIPLDVSDEESMVKYNRVSSALNLRSSAVPLVLVGEHYFTGARPAVLEQITFTISAYKSRPYEDKMKTVLEGKSTGQNISLDQQPENDILKLPVIGKIKLGNLSLFVSTIIIAFVDGFNPCSLWVLTLVLGVALHSQNRKRILAVGLCFLAVTSLIYGAFLFGAVKIVAILRFSLMFRLLLVLFTLGFALVNIKDYFKWKQGLSFTISTSGKSTLTERLRRAFNPSKGFAAIITGTLILAASAAIIELPCTAGFPVLWAQLVHKLSAGQASLVVYLPLYLIIYLIDEIIVLIIAVISLKRFTVQENKARTLKLIGGSLMLAISVHLLFFHSLLKSFAGIGTVIGTTFVFAFFMWAIRKHLEKNANNSAVSTSSTE